MLLWASPYTDSKSSNQRDQFPQSQELIKNGVRMGILATHQLLAFPKPL